MKPGGYQDLKQARTKKNYNDWFELKFAAIGSDLTVWVNGEQIMHVRDQSYSSGAVGVATYKGRSLFKDIQVQVVEEGVAAP